MNNRTIEQTNEEQRSGVTSSFKCSNVPMLFILFLNCLLLPTTSHAQYNEWTWMAGDNTTGRSGVYGTQGVAAPTNKPGARYEGGGEWVDLQGNFWHFGGGNVPTTGNDLWKFDPVTNQWTWMKGSTTTGAAGVYGALGVPNNANTPGARGYASPTCVDLQGNFWLFGGVAGSFKDDLWKYDPVTNMWTWMKGSQLTNQKGIYGIKGVPSAAGKPGARSETDAMWADDQGNIWMFGGSGFDGVGGWGNLNDLWKFDPVTGQWTWMNGSNLANQPGAYGVQGVSAPANVPGTRMVFATWKDMAGNFWIFGGASAPTYYDDLWKYNPLINEWTWIKGVNGAGNQNGTYGTKCVDDPANNPPAAFENRTRWEDDCGNFWLYGGSGTSTQRNDLWRYSHATGNWTWVSGSNLPNQVGVYGAKGVSSPANMPGDRKGNLPFLRATPSTNELWFFGGYGHLGLFNDMWRYIPDKPTASFIFNPNNGCAPAAVSFTNSSAAGCNEIKSSVWNFGDPGSGTSNTSTLTNPSHVFNAPGTYTVQLVVINCTASKDTTTQIVTVISCGNLSVSAANAAVCAGNCATIAANPIGGTTPYTYLWNPSGQTMQAVTVCSSSTATYTVTVTDANGNTGAAISTVTISPTPVASVAGNTTICIGANATLTASGGGTYLWMPGGQTTSVINPSAAGDYSVIVSNGSCSDTASATVTVLPPPVATAGNVTICSGQSATLTASGGITYLWAPGGQTTAIINPAAAGTYSVIVSIGSCSDTTSATVTVNPNPTAIAWSNVTITAGSSTTLSASGGTSYSWNNGGATSIITVLPLVTTVYCVTVTDANGCTDSECVTVYIEPIDCSTAGELYLPNAFSPNGDNENDVLKLYYGNYACIKTFKLVIYNRWGEKVFEIINPATQWDGSFRGKIEGAAVFVYYMKATLISGEEISRKGNVSMIR